MKNIAKKIIDSARGREIVIFGGVDSRYEPYYRALCGSSVKVSFFVDKRHHFIPSFCGLPVYDKSILKRDKHYVIIPRFVPNTVESIKDDLLQCDYTDNDFFSWNDSVNHDIVLNGITIGKGTGLFGSFFMNTSFIASIGRFTSINSSLMIGGDHFMGLSSSNFIPHSITSNEAQKKFHKIKIENDVWIGANVFINASKVKNIGNGAMIATGAVVIEDVPPYAVVMGVPAKIKKFRFAEEEIEILQREQWWNWDDQTIKDNVDCFMKPELFFERFK